MEKMKSLPNSGLMRILYGVVVVLLALVAACEKREIPMEERISESGMLLAKQPTSSSKQDEIWNYERALTFATENCNQVDFDPDDDSAILNQIRNLARRAGFLPGSEVWSGLGGFYDHKTHCVIAGSSGPDGDGEIDLLIFETETGEIQVIIIKHLP